MEIEFGAALAAVGLLLMGVAAASGLAQRTVLSTAVLSLLGGMALEWLGVLAIDPAAKALILIVEVVLLVTLFSDGLLVEQGLARQHWRAPARALVVAMPLNAALLACMVKALFGDLQWSSAFLLGFALSPTDPVITSSVVASSHVPARVRHAVNLESGLNDGLALPFVLLFIAASGAGAGTLLDEGGSLALESLVGVAVGAALAAAVGALLSRLPGWALSGQFEALYGLGAGLAAFGIADLLHGNGLIAAFVAGVVLAITRSDLPSVFHRFNEEVSQVLSVIAFALFGALVVATGVEASLWKVAVFILFALLVARPASILIAFLGVRLSRPEKLFIAWFGPKGIASMLFALLLLNSDAAARNLLFDVAAFTILTSIVAHGLTDTLGARWIERHMDTAGEVSAPGSPSDEPGPAGSRGASPASAAARRSS